MKKLLLCIFVITANIALANDFPNTKYEIGSCIIPTNTDWSWYQMEGKIIDIVFSKRYGVFVYVIQIPKSATPEIGFFSIEGIDKETTEVFPCSNIYTYQK